MRTLGVAAILAAMSLPAFSADLSPGDLRALLAEGDAATVVHGLDPISWETFLAHVSAGDRGWIDVVPLLQPGADAAIEQSLATALSRALSANPVGVLTLLSGDSFTVADICGTSHVEGPPAVAAQFIDAALVKVAAVTDPQLSQTRNACLHALGEARIAALI